jgi:PilZ domain
VSVDLSEDPRLQSLRTDLRRSERNSANVPAVIRTDDATVTLACVVCNLSEGGAKLLIEGSDPLPSEFILFLRPNSPVGRRCQTMWRLGDKVGVRFIAVTDFNKPGHKGSGVWAPE